jgi:hypothetical protein
VIIEKKPTTRAIRRMKAVFISLPSFRARAGGLVRFGVWLFGVVVGGWCWVRLGVGVGGWSLWSWELV